MDPNYVSGVGVGPKCTSSMTLDPDPYSEYGSGSTQVKIGQIIDKMCNIDDILHLETQQTKNFFQCLKAF